MIDVVSKTTLRGKRQHERRDMMNAAKPKGVRVNPANDDMRRVLKHPKSGNFPKSGGADWPNDRFTKRRLADGSITREEEKHEHHDDDNQRQSDQRKQSRHRVEHHEPDSAA